VREGNLKRLLPAALMAALACLASGCSDSNPVGASSGPTPVATPAAAAEPADNSFSVSGPIIVENQVDLAALREGVVVKIFADTGTRVTKGQLLALLDDRQIAADLEAQANTVHRIEFNLKNWEADLDMVRADLERSQKMWDAQLITREQLDHDKYKVAADQFQVDRERQALRSAQATQRSLELEREKTRIVAPFAGVVARRYVRLGQKVANGDRMFWVTATGPLRVKFTLPENYLSQVRKGQEFPLTSPDTPNEKHTARVIEFSPVVDPASGTIEVLAEILGPAGELRPGMTVNLRIGKPQ